MPINRIDLDTFLKLRVGNLVIDVRSEDEYTKGHMPDAVNTPILNNEERKLVGTCYKQKGNYAAVLLGYELTAHKFQQFIAQISGIASNKIVYIYCYRGGLRSTIMSQLLSNAGFTVFQLRGGYKVYRNWSLEVLRTNKHIFVLGGYTGSGKTDRLAALKALGHQVIDLEGLANHRGSAFGHIGMGSQPTIENFENQLAIEWAKIDPRKPLWLEDESRMIGRINLPENIYKQIRNSSVYKVLVSREKRLENILHIYGTMPTDQLEQATRNVARRLGDQRTNIAIEALQQGDKESWAKLMLDYYDDSYLHGNSKRNLMQVIEMEEGSFEQYIGEQYPKRLNKVTVILGGNQGDVKHAINSAKTSIEHRIGAIVHASAYYQTAAWGNTDQPDFINQVVELHTVLSPHELMSQLLQIEQDLGRVRTEKYAPRYIDLDILFYNNEIIQSDVLQIPHPKIAERRFVLAILMELSPSLIHPISQKSISLLYKECEDPLEVKRL